MKSRSCKASGLDRREGWEGCSRTGHGTGWLAAHTCFHFRAKHCMLDGWGKPVLGTEIRYEAKADFHPRHMTNIYNIIPEHIPVEGPI